MNSLHFQFDLDRNMKKFYIILQEIYRAGNKVTIKREFVSLLQGTTSADYVG
jgi:predicted DNA-binding WGR domain protein